MTTRPRGWLPTDRWARVVRDAPLVSLDLVVRTRDGHVLLGRRSNAPARGTWFVPGGVIQKDEAIAAAFERISHAELGVGVALAEARFLGVYEHFYPDNFVGARGFGTHYVVLAHELSLALEVERLPRAQHASYWLASPEELLAHPEVHPHTKAYFETGAPRA
jgi:colanic acid biosynthesis protein WcaH